MSNAPRIEVQRLRPTATMPRYMTELAAGLDVCAALDEVIDLQPGERRLIPTGLAVAIPAGYEIQVRPRSGLALKHGIALVNAPGTIDADYRGEIGVIVINHGNSAFRIESGDRIAQLVVAPVAQAILVDVAELDQTRRGAGGFGHTGKDSTGGG